MAAGSSCPPGRILITRLPYFGQEDGKSRSSSKPKAPLPAERHHR